jgi:uncharacterized protein (DUF1778 family)
MRGRPRKNPADRLSEGLRVGVTIEQWKVIADAAEVLGLTMSEFARVALQEKLERVSDEG